MTDNTQDDDQQQDRALLTAIAAGDKNALANFYREHESRVYRFALSKLGDSFAAADVLNDVMLDVWKSAHRFEGRAKVTTWLLGIAHHKVIDQWRKKGRANTTELSDTLEDESDAADPATAASGASDSKLLKLCMNKLKDEHREILHLVFFEELNYSEIADVIKVPEGTVKSRVFHARNQMKKHLAYAMRSH